MSSSSQDMLSRMRQERVAQERQPDDPYIKLLITPHRRHQLTLALVVAFGLFFFLLARGQLAGKPWWVISLPIIGIGLMMTLIPPTEAWEYKPWQTRARQYERHQIQR